MDFGPDAKRVSKKSRTSNNISIQIRSWSQNMSIEKKPGHSKAMKIVLFWSNWLLFLFLGKKLGTFAVAIIATAIMLHYLQGKVIKITIVAIWIVTLFIAAI
jgi:hypothetical protein